MPKGHYAGGMSQNTPSRDLNKFIVRLPEGMRERIAAKAKENNRSMNAEIVSRLERTLLPSYTLEFKETYSYDEVQRLYDGMNARMERMEEMIMRLLEKR